MKTNYNNLPDELKRRGLFCLWRYEKVKGRLSKTPYSLRGGRAKSTDRKSFCDFNSAVNAVSKYSGIGLGIFDGYCAVDIDHCVADGKLSELALDVINAMNSYTEYSPSGEGVRIIFRADGFKYDKEKYYINNHKIGLEIYVSGSTNKYVTLTGNVIRNVPIADRSDKLSDILNKYMCKNNCQFAVCNSQLNQYSKTSVPPLMTASSTTELSKGGIGCRGSLPDDEVLSKAKAAKNGAKFSELWSGNFDKSHSEADLALCSMLAFWCGGDVAQIDRLFRQSALYREKWERDDYREETIRKATESLGSQCAFGKNNITKPFINGASEHGNNVEAAIERRTRELDATSRCPPFIRFNDKGQPSVSVPILVKYIEENVRFLLVRDNGKQSLLKYVYEDGVYRLYSDDMFRGLIRKIIADYDIELVKMRTINEAFSLIMTSLNSIPHSVLNRDESVINFQNGLLHIGDTLELTEHSPDVLTTIQIPCDWIDEAMETPVFDSYLETLTNGDDKTKTLLLEFIGACVSNIRGWRLKKSLFMVGAGDTGKSQLKSLVERLLGKGNFIGIDLSEIEARFGTGAIYGTRLAGSSDMSFMTVSELKTFKKITGGDSLFAEFKGQQAFEYTYNGLLWFCMNRLPKFGGDDGKWVYDRIMVVNCPNVIPPEKQDKRLLDKMYRERQGIIYKAINALLNVTKNDYRFTESESVTQAREDYMTDNNTAIAFFNECMRPWVRGKIQKRCTTGRVYKVYQVWCRENNNGYAKTAKEFREELSTYLGAAFADLTVVRNGYKYYKDYGLTFEAKELYASAYGYDEDEFLSV